MKKAILVSLVLLVIGCAPKMQVWETTATNSKSVDDAWVFENDLVKITYFFWSERGVMSFTIYNKTDKPIYVDWKNSSFIHNDDKLDYWADKEVSASASYYKGFLYNGPRIPAGYTAVKGLQKTVSESRKPERITFIPPHSNYDRAAFFLFPNGNYNLTNASRIAADQRPLKRSNTIYEQSFISENTPLHFRNYLAFAFSESSQEFVFVDNGFFVSQIQQMSQKLFNGRIVGGLYDDKQIYSYPYRAGTAFYIQVVTHSQFNNDL